MEVLLSDDYELHVLFYVSKLRHTHQNHHVSQQLQAHLFHFLKEQYHTCLLKIEFAVSNTDSLQ